MRSAVIQVFSHYLVSANGIPESPLPIMSALDPDVMLLRLVQENYSHKFIPTCTVKGWGPFTSILLPRFASHHLSLTVKIL